MRLLDPSKKARQVDGTTADVMVVGPSFTSTVTAADDIPFDFLFADASLSEDRGDVQEEIRISERVKRLRDRSGLTWQQLARAFGVTRRAVHAWATGQPMSTSNVERLERIEALIEEHDMGEPHETRARLLSRAGDQNAPFAILLEELTPGREYDEPRPWIERVTGNQQ